MERLSLLRFFPWSLRTGRGGHRLPEGWAMKQTHAVLIGLLVAGALTGPASAAPKPAPIKVPVDTAVKIELAAPISTKVQKAGDTFAIRLAEPLIVKGRIVAPAGAVGVGEIIDASKPGMGGKAAKLVLAADYFTLGRTRIPLRALQVTGSGRGYSNTANVIGIGGIGFAPLGFVAMAIRGGDVVLPAGTNGMAKIAASVTLPSLGRAPRGAANASTIVTEVSDGLIPVPPPPPGSGQVVFFRAKSLLGTGQWFNVREGGKALGRLDNGAYFIDVTNPGLHTYTAQTEPEFTDKLKLKIDAGETYFVSGALTKGVVIGAANLEPSDRGMFNKASKTLKLALTPAPEKVVERIAEKPGDTAPAPR
jgi:hypothetical protein